MLANTNCSFSLTASLLLSQLADTKDAYDYLVENHSIAVEDASAAEVARKQRHTIASRTFELILAEGMGAVSYQQLEVTSVKRSSVHYCFDGQTEGDSVLLMSELSHFWTEGQGYCHGCFQGRGDDCTADNEVYTFSEVLMERNNDAGTKTTGDFIKATAHRLERAKGFFDRRRGEKAEFWVLVYLSDVGDARQSQLDSNIVPVQLVTGDVLFTGAMKRAHVLAHWPSAVVYESKYTAPSTAVEPVPLEKVVSPLFKMFALRRAASSSSSSSTSFSSSYSSSSSASLSAALLPADGQFLLPPGVLQAAKAVIARDKEMFPPDALL
jgi:hypothetical protein